MRVRADSDTSLRGGTRIGRLWNRVVFMGTCFFFSSRRRHTRLLCDWSSDVCSSDLLIKEGYINAVVTSGANIVHDLIEAMGRAHFVEIGRASCRERV